MSTGALARPLTYEEERGKPVPSFNHGAIQANLIGEFIRQREFRICSELSLELGGEPFTPDLSIYRRGPLDLRHDTLRATDPPLLAVEILSPTTAKRDRGIKLKAYARFGVKEYWIIDPAAQAVEVHRLSSGGYELAGTFDLDDTLSSALLPGFEIEVASIFAL